MSVTTDGVQITLDGEPVTLKFTLGASKKIGALFGDFVTAYSRISKFDPEAYAMVVAAALGKEVREVEDAVFRAGMDTLRVDFNEYLAWLSNGGRKPEPIKKDSNQGNV